MYLVIVFSLALLVVGLAENFFHQKNLRSIPMRILVNGTRGKSSVTRLIAGALREAGYTTIAKTTGSNACIILADGNEIPVRRPLGPRITEQKALARLAARQKAQALVVECMAVRPESQLLMQSQFVRPTITVITNVRVDHVEEMGPSIADTEAALAFSIPTHGTLITADARFADTPYGRIATRTVVANLSEVSPEMLDRMPYPAFAENLAVALQVAAELGIDRETAFKGMINAKPDIGVLRLFAVESANYRLTFINGFAANDMLSTQMVWQEAMGQLPQEAPLVVVYNNRADREYRIPEFLGISGTIEGIRLVVAMGEHAGKVARMFQKKGMETMTYEAGSDFKVLFSTIAARVGRSFLLFGIGNLHGMGITMVNYCMKHGTALERNKEGECSKNR